MLLRIFTAGPIAGFLVSATVLMVGVALSQTTASVPEGSFILGDSLLILGFQKVVFPGMKPGEEVLLHPLGLAGIAGLYFNLSRCFLPDDWTVAAWCMRYSVIGRRSS